MQALNRRILGIGTVVTDQVTVMAKRSSACRQIRRKVLLRLRKLLLIYINRTVFGRDLRVGSLLNRFLLRSATK